MKENLYWNNYLCLFFKTYILQETTETVTFRMLDKVVATQMISQTIEKQIRPYMREHNLREDIIFSKYITVNFLQNYY
jgi:hypothetical protein